MDGSNANTPGESLQNEPANLINSSEGVNLNTSNGSSLQSAANAPNLANKSYTQAAYAPNSSYTQNAAYMPRKPKEKFKPLMADFVFAIIAFIIGYLFSRWVLFAWQGWGVAAFTIIYLLTVTFYLLKKDAHTNSISAWFWCIVTLATGISYALWENKGMMYHRNLFLFCSAVYYVIVASNRTIMGKTGNMLLLDGINAVFIIPFRNFINQYLSFGILKKEKQKKGRTLPIFLGILFGVILLMGLIPLLLRADSGGFEVVVRFFVSNIQRIADSIGEVIFYFVIGIPVAAYIYGLVSGSAHGRATDTIDPESSKKTVEALRVFQPATVFIALGTVCVLYLVFILSQIPYFFSAFTGRRPEGWMIYAEYARKGFFELCVIAVINLVIITVGNLTSRKQRSRSRLLKSFNIAFAFITLLIIATAFSKMILYIDAYGLTMLRLLPCVFMIFMLGVFGALVALQKWDFSIVRFALVTGCVIFCVLCLSNPDALVVRYNTDRFLDGTLAEYDVDILYRAGSAGVSSAVKVYKTTSDEAVKGEILIYLKSQRHNVWHGSATGYNTGYNRSSNEYNLEMYRAHWDYIDILN